MESLSIMDKKNAPRGNVLSTKNSQDPVKTDFNGRKNSQQYPRKREYEKYESGKRPPNNRGGRAGQRNVRPREKVGCQVGEYRNNNGDSEFGSLQKFGSKKQNITHLLNWWGPGPIDQHSRNSKASSYGPNKRKVSLHHKYNKEHFLQANCQFVVSEGEDYSDYKIDPDRLVDWMFVEEVRLHMTDPPSCPICLFPPTAAKVTRCGHIYCFPCILHYLALSDEKWRKCPICFEAVHKDDLKSVVAIVDKDCSLGEEIELQLTRRERDSLVPVPVSCFDVKKSCQVATYSTPIEVISFSKLIVATKKEVTDHILGREMKDLHVQLAIEGDQPEACFIQEALSLIENRKKSLLNDACTTAKLEGDEAIDNEMAHSASSLSLSSPEDTTPPTPIFEPEKNIQQQEGMLINQNVTAEDLDISQLQNFSKLPEGHENKNGPKQTFFFYQASSGAHIYLHALNVKMLVREFGSLESCPLKIKGRILEKETAVMSGELRNRLRYLRHLPLTCNFDVVEIELTEPLISPGTRLEFQEWLDQRERKRKKRAREERKVERRARAEEDRMMGRSKGARINLQSERHFPVFTEDPPLSFVGAEAAPESEVASLSSSVSSDTADRSVPSFAQMIRDGHRSAPAPAWPSLNSSSQNSKPKNINDSSDSVDAKDEEGEKVPDFSTSFSNAFAKALDDAAAKKAANSSPAQGISKKKRKKGILLMSSGAL